MVAGMMFRRRMGIEMGFRYGPGDRDGEGLTRQQETINRSGTEGGRRERENEKYGRRSHRS